MADESEALRHLEALGHEVERLGGDLALRAKDLAALTEAMADEAERFAGMLEDAAATRGDADRRLALARREREIAAIGRRNAGRLRSAGWHAGFEPYPHLTSA